MYIFGHTDFYRTKELEGEILADDKSVLYAAFS